MVKVVLMTPNERRAAVSAATTLPRPAPARADPSPCHASLPRCPAPVLPERHIASDAQDKGATPKSKSSSASASVTIPESKRNDARGEGRMY